MNTDTREPYYGNDTLTKKVVEEAVLELFKVDYKGSEIKIFKNNMFPNNTVFLSPDLYEQLSNYFKDQENKK